MSRMLTSSLITCVSGCLVAGFAAATFAQTTPRPTNANTQNPRQPRPQGGAELQVQNVPPELDRLLHQWSQASSKIQKLQGTHRRFVYDKVFMVEKRSLGVFYYEAPSKGRIDLKPATIERGEQSKQLDQSMQPYKLQADRPERWMCDGQDIWQVNDATKQVDVFPIPPESQGQNIMDGPLPFLFGMPPAKAKLRYELSLIQDDANHAVLQVKPRLRLDAANWREAKVILDKQQFLPRAVRLLDPSGNLETTYTFSDFKINDPGPNLFQKALGIEDKNPFRPELKGYQFTVHKAEEKAPIAQGPMVPSIIGFRWQDAKTLLEKAGCQVKIYTGKAAPEEKLTYVVYEQNPPAKTPLQKNQLITLTIYNKGEAPAAAPQPGQVPAVLGLFWKDAGTVLEKAGYQVKYLPGQVAPAKEKLYTIYQQNPQPGQALKPGSEVSLTVYNKGE